MDKLSKSIIFKRLKKELLENYDEEQVNQIWEEANKQLSIMETVYPEMDADSKMMILPAASLYIALNKYDSKNALSILKNYGTEMGKKIGKVMHVITSIPGVSKLLWRNMPKLMRKMSSEEKGYKREIVSETNELVGVDILSCPLHEASLMIGVPEAALVVCAMDKAYMTGFKYIDYTRTTSVAEGDRCCDYRLRYNKNKK